MVEKKLFDDFYQIKTDGGRTIVFKIDNKKFSKEEESHLWGKQKKKKNE